MIFLISIILAVLLVLLLGKPLKKHPVPFYLVAVIISVFVAVCTWTSVPFPAFFGKWIWPVFARGGLAGALFVIVMVSGAFPNGSEPIRKLLPLRGELSILACILTLGHNAAYGKTYFVMLFSNPGRLPVPQLIAAVCSLLMLAIMLPLFVTSFITIRKRMKAKTWKRLQRFAYGFYALLCLHILLLTVPNAIQGRSGYRTTVVIYGTVFLSYAACRILKAIAKKHKKVERLAQKQVISVIISFVIVLILLLSAIGITQLQKSDADVSLGTPSVTPSELNPEQTNVSNTDTDTPMTTYRNGTYRGTATGNSPGLTVDVTVENDRITKIDIASHNEDNPYFSWALDVIDSILDTNSVNVDTVSGATYSSGGILDAVANALSKAKN